VKISKETLTDIELKKLKKKLYNYDEAVWMNKVSCRKSTDKRRKRKEKYIQREISEALLESFE
jgi:GTPase involved in cell partitioning and DNA repair